MKVAIVCPFNIERLTGSPKRAATAIRAASSVSTVFSISASGKPDESVQSLQVGHIGILGFTRKAFSALRTFRPDIVHALTPASVPTMLLYRLMHPRVKVIYELHGWAWYEQERFSSVWKRTCFLIFDYLGLWLAHTVVCVSFSAQRFLGKRTFSRNRIHPIWDPIDFICDYTPRRGTGVVVGYLGNAAWYQGIEHILDAARILSGDTGISFRLAGLGTQATTDIPNIAYVSVPKDETISFLQSCDILLSSRISSPVSEVQIAHKLLEYMSAGRSVIVSKTNDQEMIVVGAQCGFVAHPLSGETIAAAVRAFADLSADERKMQALGAINFARKNFYVEGYTLKIQELYKRVLTSGSPSTV